MKYMLLTGLLLGSLTVQAQVSGTVKDQTGEPIIGANVFWKNIPGGVATREDGTFSISKPDKSNHLIVSFIGYENDTIQVNDKKAILDVVLREGMELSEVQIVSRKLSTLKLRSSVMNEEIITSDELCRAACCNLGESFVTNPSVDVSYSDAATGAKQIKLLGLSGTYVQMLTENIPNYRGAASPYGLGYVPGPWMHSIQVSKGISSVKNGYEALTGQINVEFKKPQLPEADWVSANLFASTTNRYEANADATVKLSKRWSTSLLAHYENETKAHDGNDDGFADIPRIEQYNFWNRWAYMGDHYVFQAGIKALDESRKGGQVSHSGVPAADRYEIDIDTRRYEAFTKNAYIFNKEKNTNLALILSGTLHNQDALYGRKIYNVDQSNAYASLMFETEFMKEHNLSAGFSYNYDGYDQHYRLTNDAETPLTKAFARESVGGAYAQYTFNLDNKFVLMAGLRGDHSSEYGFFVTPRAHIKYNPNDFVHFRLSAGKGYRTNHVLAENNYLMASSRKVSIADHLDQEEAWNYGASISGYIPLFGKTLNLNLEYYYTDFLKQVVVDMDTNPHEVAFYNLDGRSYSQVFQVEATYPFFQGFSLTAAYRWTDAKTTYNHQLMEKPLTGKYKGLVTASYQTPLGLWQFDATWQMNGGGRMPNPYTLADGTSSWDARYKGFSQLSAQVTRYFRRWSIYIGGENLTNFKQKNPIIDAADPWGDRFDSTMIWGPVHGAKGYIGVRFNLARD
ncbi:TonB-dependent receptor [Bacteroides fragilis]|uniref:TonB-dependent receptor n=1 Tax=Bacteroides fragilis TaxID=817 RepID=UPI000448123A|nr:TonB-dependent receptor [Bacteroides fragilis]EYB14086.1 tonB-dependent Receptor Plug domain protein [Bacteroides fragilis str. S38L3]MCE9295104.1 TonB-dependent receptor [Bacteroides fragilis]MCE9311969.1 TonB-dependent receptor [Bacteroides fragilis]MCZ2690836.1 TonB-dependent receptor [Bacteroides fragilis]THC76842.1 TonB-dependent receptor [Bacteroides fragilis]